MEEKILDYVLVPTGLAVMVAYHLWLLHRILRRPTITVVGINSINRRLWVAAMMADAGKMGVLAVQTLRNNIMASTLLASTSIMLSSVIAVLMTGVGGRPTMDFVFGDKSRMGFSVKFFSILVCFLLAFLFNVQSIRYYSHASILINVPISATTGCKKIRHRLSMEYVAMMVNRGSYFWSLGLRTFYFSLPLFLWIFGPIPMFSSCLILVFLLYFLDVTLHFGAAILDDDSDENGIAIHIDDEESK